MDKNLIQALTLCFNKSPEDAVRFLESKGIRITWDWKAQLDAIKTHAFTVAKVSGADILQLFKGELESAMKEGKTYKEFKEEIEPVLQDKGYAKREDGSAWRLDTIFRTNLQSSYMAGRYRNMVEVKKEFPYWELVVVSDRRTTDLCRDVAGVILPADDPFWNGNVPPRHFNCRSRTRAFNKSMLVRADKNISKSGDYSNVKPAEGFDTAPGEWKPETKKYFPKLRKVLDKILK